MAVVPPIGLVPFPPSKDPGGFTVIPFPSLVGANLDAIILPGTAFGAIVLTKETLPGELEAGEVDARELGFKRAAIFAPIPPKFFLTLVLAEGALAASSLAPKGTGLVAVAGIVLAPGNCGICGLGRLAPGEFQEFNRSH